MGFEDKDMVKVNGVWVDDVVQYMFYVFDGWVYEVIGKDGLIVYYVGWFEVVGIVIFIDEIIFYFMVDLQIVYVEFKGVVDIVFIGNIYCQSYGSLFYVENGKIMFY